MSIKKISFAAGLVAIASVSNASFELGLVLDAGTRSVHRFDMESGAYFGSFGAGWLNDPQAIMLDQANNRVWVIDNDGLSARVKILGFNYNSGGRDGSVPINLGYSEPIQAVRRANGEFIISGNSISDRFSSTGSYLSQMYTGGLNQGGVGIGSDGFLYTAVHSTQTVVRTSQTSGTALATSAASVFGTTGEGQMISNNGRMYFATGLSTVFSIQEGFANGAGGFLQLNATNFSATKALGVGHNRIMYIAGRNAANTAGLIERWDPVISSFGGTFGGSVLQNPVSMAVVVAPEPGTLLALGGLTLAVVRRRRKA
jgi:hypothetical protein